MFLPFALPRLTRAKPTHLPPRLLLCCMHPTKASCYVRFSLHTVVLHISGLLLTLTSDDPPNPPRVQSLTIIVLHIIVLKNCLEVMALTLGGEPQPELPYRWWRDLPVTCRLRPPTGPACYRKFLTCRDPRTSLFLTLFSLQSKHNQLLIDSCTFSV